MAGELITALPAVLSLGTCTRARAPSLPGRLVSRQHAIGVGALGATLSGYDPVRAGLARAVYPDEAIDAEAHTLVRLSAADLALARRAKHSADLGLGPRAAFWAAVIEIERGVQTRPLAASIRRDGRPRPRRQPSNQSTTG
jgi:enoyl-CoA hydratase/carnithine racemase